MGAGTSYSMPWVTNSSSVLQGSWRTRALWSGHTGAGPHCVRRRSGLRWREGGGPRAEPFGDEFGDVGAGVAQRDGAVAVDGDPVLLQGEVLGGEPEVDRVAGQVAGVAGVGDVEADQHGVALAVHLDGADRELPAGVERIRPVE